MGQEKADRQLQSYGSVFFLRQSTFVSSPHVVCTTSLILQVLKDRSKIIMSTNSYKKKKKYSKIMSCLCSNIQQILVKNTCKLVLCGSKPYFLPQHLKDFSNKVIFAAFGTVVFCCRFINCIQQGGFKQEYFQI